MNNNTFNLLLLHPPLSLVTGRLSWYCAEWGVYCFHPVLLEALRQAVFLMFATSCSFSDMTTWRDVSEKTSWGKSEALWRRAAPPTVDAKCEPKVNIWLSLSIHAGNPHSYQNPPALKFSDVNWTWCCHVGKRRQWHWGEIIQKSRALRVVNLQEHLTQFISRIFLPREFLPSFLASYVYTDVIGDFKI